MSLLSYSGVNTLFCSTSPSLNFVWLESGRNELGIQRLSNRYRIYAGDSLCALSSLSEASSTAQIHGDQSVIEASRGVRGIIALEAVLIVPLLSLLWDESAHLVIVSLSEYLIYGLLRDDAVDCSLFEHLVVVAGGWFKDIFSYTWN